MIRQTFLVRSKVAANKGFAIAEIPCFADIFVQRGSSVLRMKFSTKIPPPSQTLESLPANVKDYTTTIKQLI